MKKDYTDITFIIDASGSMGSLISDTLGGFNNFIDQQKKVEGECTVNLYQFNNRLYPVFEHKNLQEVPELTTDNYRPGGSTALLDAIGKVVDATGQRYANMPEEQRPENVVVVIITDGLENSSRAFSNEQIREKIKHQTEVYDWEFTYLGANQDAFSVAEGMGMHRAASYKVEKTGEMYNVMSKKLAILRKAKNASRSEKRSMMNFNAEDHKDLE